VTFVFLGIALVWSVLAVDLVAESAARGGRAIVLFGGVLARTPVETGILAVAAAAASAAVALVAAAAFVRGRWLERRLADEVDERYQEISVKAAGWEAREDLIRWQIADLERQQAKLIAKRDELIADMQTARRTTSDLRRVARKQKAAIDRVVRAADDVVIVPDPGDAGDGSEEPFQVPDADSSVPATAPPAPHKELWSRLVGRD
jgi:hypothetical protein